MSAEPEPGARLLESAALAPGEARALDFRAGDAMFSVILARTPAGALKAYRNVCPHAGAPLERPDGRVHFPEGARLICAMHGASFSIEDGASETSLCRAPLRSWPVGEAAGWIVAGA